VMLPASTIRVK